MKKGKLEELVLWKNFKGISKNNYLTKTVRCYKQKRVRRENVTKKTEAYDGTLSIFEETLTKYYEVYVK